MEPVLRAQTSDGEQYDDPSEDALFELLADLQADEHLIVERLADASGQTFAQVLRTGAGYLVERREGSEQSHLHAHSTDLRAVHEDLTTWAHLVPRPARLQWAPGYGG